MKRVLAVVAAAAVVLAAVLAAILLSGPAAPADPAQMTARQLVRAVATTYARADSYRDRGVVTVEYFPEDRPPHTDVLTFETTFAAPARLRFEFRSDPGLPGAEGGHRYVVWANGRAIESWWELTGEQQTHSSMGGALAGPTGISAAAAVMVPGTLMPRMNWGTGYFRLHDPQRHGEEVVDGRPCLVVEGRSVSGTMRLWVDRDSLLVRKAYREQTTRGVLAKMTYRYEPQVGVEIAEDAFQRDPPPASNGEGDIEGKPGKAG